MACCGKLRNIKFEDASARILSVERIHRILVSWKLGPTAQRLDNLVFYVERSESSEEWQTLNGEPISATNSIYEYVDYTPMLFDQHKNYYYRIKAVELDPSSGDPCQEFISDSFAVGRDIDHVSLYMIEELQFKYRYVSGVPILIYKKRRDGEACPVCWDPILKKVTRSNCQTCYGTGKLDGYYNPIEGWGDVLSPNVEQATIGQQGVIQPESRNMEFTNYPDIRVGDVIMEVEPHKFWYVTAKTSPTKSGIVITQSLQLTYVNRSDIEYKLPLPQDTISRLISELRERRDETEF